MKWSDGSDFTANDVVFTWRYCIDEETGCIGEDAFFGIESVNAIDDLTVRVEFDAPVPYPYTAFVGAGTPIISSAQFAECVGAAARTCERQNTAPLGTGPYRITEFTPNEGAVYERNPFYWGETPYFDRVVIKGGGDAITAARSVLEADEADYAWNLQVDPGTLADMEAAGQGTVVSAFSDLVERIVINHTNPDPVLGDDRSEYLDGTNPHPFLTFTPITQAMSMAIDRTQISEPLYGFAGKPACNIIIAPSRYASTANDGCLTQNIEGANSFSTTTACWILTVTAFVSTTAFHCELPTRPPPTPSDRTRRRSSAIGGARLESRPNSSSMTPASSSAETRSWTKRLLIEGSSRMYRCTPPAQASILNSICPASDAHASRCSITTGQTATTPVHAAPNLTRSLNNWSNQGWERNGTLW